MSFAFAPVTKTIITLVCATSLLAAASSRQYLFQLPLSPHLTRDHQLWRLFAHHFAFTNSAELFIGIILLFYASVRVERNFGSTKFASFLLITLVLCTLMELAALVLGQKVGFASVPAGPFGITFSIVYNYSCMVPSMYHFSVFGIDITNKIWLYLLAGQLFSSQPPHSVIVSLIGVLAGALFRADILGVRRYRISPLLSRLASRAITPVIGETPLPNRANHAVLGAGLDPGNRGATTGFSLATMSGQAAAPVPVQRRPAGAVTPPTAATAGTAAASAATSPQQPIQPGLLAQWGRGLTGSAAVQPTPEQVDTMRAMFPERSRAEIVAALQSSQLDVNRAAGVLLAV